LKNFFLSLANVNPNIPETTINVSSLLLSGVLRIDAQLIPDYPFLGFANVSFLTLPVFELSLTSFGGLNLTSSPVVHAWLNTSIAAYLKEVRYY
jgi:Ca2+-dependent lipid-binding protein